METSDRKIYCPDCRKPVGELAFGFHQCGYCSRLFRPVDLVCEPILEWYETALNDWPTKVWMSDKQDIHFEVRQEADRLWTIYLGRLSEKGFRSVDEAKSVAQTVYSNFWRAKL